MDQKTKIINFTARTFRVLVAVVFGYTIYDLFFRNILTRKIHIFLYIVTWLILSYLIIPNITKIITKIYLPEYFIGRSRTSDGVLGDSVNLLIDGSKEDIEAAFLKMGWTKSDKITLRSSLKIIKSSLLHQSYPTAPVSSLFLFSKKQDLAFEKEIAGSPKQRHHIRLWETPQDYYLPGGVKSDWVCAASLDIGIRFSLFTGQITHRIDENIDEERNLIANELIDHGLVEERKLYTHFTNPYRSRNGGGDKISTDGSLVYLKLRKKPNKR